jgi:hypothetical protein
MKLPQSFTTVTPLSKVIAILLFASLPFIGFYFGIKFQQSVSVPFEANPIISTPSVIPTASTPSVNNIDDAKNSLIEYFTLLHEEKFEEAVQYHGSGYEYVKSGNVSNDNRPASLLKHWCLYQPCLKVSSVVKEQKISPSEFLFTVQFANDDGTIYKKGPCCGASEETMPTQTSFDFTVKKINDRYLVVSQLIYVIVLRIFLPPTIEVY